MIARVTSYVDNYRVKAQYARDVHELDGRKARRALTEFVNQKICTEMGLGPEVQYLVDIGCGDGCLLRMARAAGVRSVLGLSATEEEAARLRQLGLNVAQSLTDHLRVPDAVADAVVCNDVLLIVARENISASLAEIHRIARPGARVWIGEIPYKMELAGVPRHQTVGAMLGYLLRTHGLRTFLGMCRRIAFSSIVGKPIVLNTAPHLGFYAEPAEFIRMAEAAGLRLERYSPHQELDAIGKVRLSETRLNYLFTKPSVM